MPKGGGVLQVGNTATTTVSITAAESFSLASSPTRFRIGGAQPFRAVLFRACLRTASSRRWSCVQVSRGAGSFSICRTLEYTYAGTLAAPARLELCDQCADRASLDG